MMLRFATQIPTFIIILTSGSHPTFQELHNKSIATMVFPIKFWEDLMELRLSLWSGSTEVQGSAFSLETFPKAEQVVVLKN